MNEHLLNDAITFYLSSSGIIISIITLLYSLAIGKKEELLIISEVTKKGSKDPLILSKQTYIIKYIRKIRKAIRILIYGLILSIFCLIISWISLRFVPKTFHIAVLVLIGCITLILGALFLHMAINVIKRYKNELDV